MQQENLQLLSKRVGNLSIPVPLLAPVAAYALFADRLLGKTIYAIPYRAAGVQYKLKSLPGKFTGVHLLAIMFTAFRQIDPTMETGADFGAEYEAALQMQKK